MEPGRCGTGESASLENPRVMWTLRSALLFLVPATLLVAARTHTTNPMSSAEDFEEGKRLYRIHCGVCHGMEGRTGRGARLARRSYRRGNSDAELFDLIEAGVPGTDMPGLWMDEDSIWRILLFVRTFAEQASLACEAGAADAAAGKDVFENKGSCLACHTVGSEGGRLGPDMSFAGEMYTAEQLRTALLAPARHISDRYQTVRLVTRDGDHVEGVRLNENLYQVHLMDRAENLRSFSKDRLTSLEQPQESLMPAYGDLLSESDLANLVAYLCTLGESPKEDRQ